MVDRLALSKQIHIYSIDTSAFYTRKERKLHILLYKFRKERDELVNKINNIEKDLKDLEESNGEYGCLLNKKTFYLEKKTYKINLITETKNHLLDILKDRVEKNNNISTKFIRQVDKRYLRDKNVVSVFDSFLTRMLELQENTLTTDMIIIKVYYFDILKDIIKNGFILNGEKYRFLTSSAGQIRTKKTVFIKETLWKEYERTLMCGLTVDEINKKGGINVNKYLAYLALSNSATDIWTDFDITKAIVVPDFETKVKGYVDLIDDETYEVNRVEMDVPITHTDGCGMMLPSVSQKNFMVRLPWLKGLLSVFDFKKFIKECNGNPIIEDIYGKSYNIIEDDIQIIFTESQFKMHKYYDSWQQYIDFYNEYNCSAGICNIEEDRIPNAKINYQMMQTLVDMSPSELKTVAKKSIRKLNNLTSTVKSMLEAFGVTTFNNNKTYLQQALEVYPEMLSDVYMKEVIRQIKNSLIKNYKSAKLEISGKYTFLIPDLYAFCEWLFLGIKNPEGLLKNKEVYCKLYSKSEKLDCLRSPHLYREHAIRNNVIDEEKSKWFITDAIYTSSHDLISKILQFDNDGDKSLVVADKTLIEVAERNMQGIVPLYYNMRKAEPVELNNSNIYNGLNSAYVGGNIGAISNDITKIWNSEVWNSNDEELKNEALKVIKLLCMENNFTIDFAKTLYKPERPKEIDRLIKKYTKAKLPYFFQYAKDKKRKQVEVLNNSVVNQLDKIIKNNRLRFKVSDFGEFNYALLMKNPDVILDEDVVDEYIVLNRQYHYKINMESEYKNNISHIAEKIRNSLSDYEYSDEEITDILVKYLYGIKNSKSKESLWFCYGNIIVNNLKRNIGDKTSVCSKCGKRYHKDLPQQKYCDDCDNTYERIENKKIVCVDCGKEFEVDGVVKNKYRCDDCQKEEVKRIKREYWHKNKLKN